MKKAFVRFTFLVAAILLILLITKKPTASQPSDGEVPSGQTGNVLSGTENIPLAQGIQPYEKPLDAASAEQLIIPVGLSEFGGQLLDETTIQHRYKTIDKDGELIIQTTAIAGSEFTFCRDRDCQPLEGTSRILIGKLLRPGHTSFTLTFRGTTGTEMKHLFEVTLFDPATSFDGERLLQLTRTVQDALMPCYELGATWTAEAMQTCLAQVRKGHTLTKTAACELLDGAYANSYLETKRAGKYAETSKRLKQDGKLYYAVQIGDDAATATCEHPGFELYLYSYDCTTQESTTLYEFADAGIPQGNCAVEIGGVKDGTVIYRKYPYEWHCSLFEGYEVVDLSGTVTTWLNFFLADQEAQQLDLTTMLDLSDRETILKNTADLRSRYYAPSVDECQAGGFKLLNITDTNATLRRTFDQFTLDGRTYALVKDFPLRIDWSQRALP